MRLWDKGEPLDRRVLDFTVGEDHRLDLRLVKYDCMASQAHARMLQKIGILTKKETDALVRGLSEIMDLVEKGEFTISKEQEDCHTAIEEFLTAKCGEAGKKIHLGRSRNDQVLTALRLYEKKMLSGLEKTLQTFNETLARVIRKYGKIRIPGYTHMRKAMPTSVGVWLGSFSEAVVDDLTLLKTIFKIVDKSPLGTAAGFGTPVFKLDRHMTAESMGFASVQKNPMYSQFSRGKFEMSILGLLSGIMLIMNRLATDLLLFSMEEFGFVVLPDAFCTGSSIMPQKKNPDVLELIRASFAVVCGEECKVKSLVSNLMSGYNRDLQLTKGALFHAYDTTKDCIDIMILILTGIEVDEKKCRSAITDEMYATEEAYSLVKQGLPFREAYRKVAEKYKAGRLKS
jgi:argininosuccinate lyase